MSIRERKERETSQLREKILNAALRVFAEQGYDKVSMRKISALIDYSPTTIYRFFANKEDLLRTIAGSTFGELAARFEQGRTAAPDDPLATLRILAREYLTYCVEHPDMFRLFLDIATFEVEDGVIYERLGETRYRVFRSWFDCLHRASRSGRLAAGQEMRVFLFLWDAVTGYVEHRIRFPKMPRLPLVPDAEAYLDLLFAGLFQARLIVRSSKEDTYE
jgi:AcrR family transcriptional regulator